MTRAVAAAAVLLALAAVRPLSAQALPRSVAITVDDLPRGGDGSPPNAFGLR